MYEFFYVASRRKIDHQSHERDKETLANAEDREGSGDGQGRSMRSASKGGESTRRKAEGWGSGTWKEIGADGTRLGIEQSPIGKVE